MENKMLREIANDAITPKKTNKKVQMTYMRSKLTMISMKDWIMTTK